MKRAVIGSGLGFGLGETEEGGGETGEIGEGEGVRQRD